MDLRQQPYNIIKNQMDNPNNVLNSSCTKPLKNVDINGINEIGELNLEAKTTESNKDVANENDDKIQLESQTTSRTSIGAPTENIKTQPQPQLQQEKNTPKLNNENCTGVETNIGKKNSKPQANSSTNIKNLPSVKKTAVLVEHGYKNYGSQNILNDFNMNVEENTIYGLLGSSGCGKTTMLSCIVALRKLDSGKIWIDGKPTGTKVSGIPGKKVGYMPQEIALNGEFNIIEVLQYFGRIFGMTQSVIQARYRYLIKLLSLENCTDLIRNFSDGQKRRVSLAVALLHQPDILILDEPTVGCDPLLRQSIWRFLTELVSQARVTVIITTHYIEETRQADRVGIMRNGRLLVEDSPSQLLIQYNASLLDDIVLTLCRRDKTNDDDEIDDDELTAPIGSIRQRLIRFTKSSLLPNFITNKFAKGHGNDSASESERLKQNETNGTSKHLFVGSTQQDVVEDDEKIQTKLSDRLRALTIKNVIVLLRNWWSLLFTISIPAITIILFCLTIGSDPFGLRLGVINNEIIKGRGSVPFPKNVICPVNNPWTCLGANLSCLYLDSLPKNQLELIPFNNTQDALEQVHQKNLLGYILFEPQFSKYIFPRLLLGKRNDETIYGSTIKIRLDMSNKDIGQTVKKLLLDGFRSFTTRLFESCSIDPIGRDLPLIFETPFYGTDDNVFTDFMAPGLSLGFVFFMATLTCGITYIIEKKDGMINRVLVTGVSTIEIMLSHFIVQFIVVVVQVLVVFIILLYVFNITCQGSIVLAFFLFLLSCVTGMTLGFLAAVFCSEEKYAIFVALGCVFPSIILAGVIWPLEGIPQVIRYGSYLIPTTFPAEALKSVLLRGFDINHHEVFYGIISSIGWICLYLTMILYWNRFRRNT